MKMFNKNGKMSVLGGVILEENMKRMAANHDPMEIVNSLIHQLKIVEYNGAFVDESGHYTIWFWQSMKRGMYYARRLTPTLTMNSSEPIVLEGTVMP